MLDSLTANDVVQFLLANRCGKVIANWTEHEIAATVVQSISDGCFVWSCDERGRLNGVVLGLRKGPNHVHVSAILLTAGAKLRTFLAYFEQHFPAGTKLTGYRQKSNRLITYYG